MQGISDIETAWAAELVKNGFSFNPEKDSNTAVIFFGKTPLYISLSVLSSIVGGFDIEQVTSFSYETGLTLVIRKPKAYHPSRDHLIMELWNQVFFTTPDEKDGAIKITLMSHYSNRLIKSTLNRLGFKLVGKKPYAEGFKIKQK